MLIKNIIEDGSEVILIPRPRRFGKTLAMTMMRTFFDINEKESRSLFENLEIGNEQEIMQKQGQFPVIYLTLKDIKHNSWEDCLSSFRFQISRLFGQHEHLLNGSELSGFEKQ